MCKVQSKRSKHDTRGFTKEQERELSSNDSDLDDNQMTILRMKAENKMHQKESKNEIVLLK